MTADERARALVTLEQCRIWLGDFEVCVSLFDGEIHAEKLAHAIAHVLTEHERETLERAAAACEREASEHREDAAYSAAMDCARAIRELAREVR